MLLKIGKRFLEVVYGFSLLCGAIAAIIFVDGIVADEFYLNDPRVYAESYVLTDPVYIVPSLALLALYAFLTWRIMAGLMRCSMRVVAVVFLIGIAVLLAVDFLPGPLLMMPGWFALVGKALLVLDALWPAVWLFLPRREYIPLVELDDPPRGATPSEMRKMNIYSGQ